MKSSNGKHHWANCRCKPRTGHEHQERSHSLTRPAEPALARPAILSKNNALRSRTQEACCNISSLQHSHVPNTALWSPSETNIDALASVHLLCVGICNSNTDGVAQISTSRSPRCIALLTASACMSASTTRRHFRTVML